MNLALNQLVRSASHAPLVDSAAQAAAFEEHQVRTVMQDFELDREGFCDLFAQTTAELFLSGTLSFDEADNAINALSWYASMGSWHMELLPEFSWLVYQAFDAGEHDHGGRVTNAIEQLTKPRLIALLERSLA
ncbi:hypothetical protein [Pseudomarimonas salicorniae]|uniref:Uncharacterized protein n=1 Tax=Pseudomarimonas salicorniae TaxID=2933270 RepID=A0ABT0GFF9_9GAMM|nr:hypothetical protein [Lysobacter sp. CAU 1642]MCK7593173.1 hypothetical protein [Lysobacter sp. CAU 1642]